MALGNYESETWIRDEIDVRDEERPLRLEDAVAYELGEVSIRDGTVKFTKDAISDAWMGKSTWLKLSGYDNERYQEALDKYIMRRQVSTVSAHRECLSSSYNAENINADSEISVDGTITIKHPGGTNTFQVDETNPGKWKTQSYHAEDKHTGDQSTVRVTIIKYGYWHLSKVKD